MLDQVSRARMPGLRVSIVVPARNEARNLALILPKLPQAHQVIVVDGHSVDDTIAVARRILPSAEVIQQTRRGKGNALACGFAAATGDVIVMFDADGSADPNEIPAFVAAIAAGADVAKGSRFLEQGGSDDLTLVRRLGNAMLNWLANRAFGASYTDLCYGYNAFVRDALPALALPPTTGVHPEDVMHWGDGFEIETVLNCRFSALGLKVVEVPSHELLRVHGQSNLSPVRDGIRVLRTIWDEWRRSRNQVPTMVQTRASAARVLSPRT